MIHASPFLPRPPHTEHARLARWLVHAVDWGTVSTTSVHLDGIAFGNALSYSDGPVGHSTGRLLFYLTTMDATAADVAVHPNATLTICEAQLPGGCGDMDPEDPTCAKLSITGELAPVRGGADAEDEARAMLFARHPQMADWPKGHEFQVYELTPATLRLLDFYGGPHDISPTDYFAAELDGIAAQNI